MARKEKRAKKTRRPTERSPAKKPKAAPVFLMYVKMKKIRDNFYGLMQGHTNIQPKI